MKKSLYQIIVMMLITMMFLIGCSNSTSNETISEVVATSTVSVEPTMQATEVIVPTETVVVLVSNVPETLPEDLGGKTVYGYILDIMKQYLPDDIFTNDSYTDQQKFDARGAIALVLQVSNEQLYEKPDQYWLHIRGRGYSQQFFDTKDIAYKELALADFQQALDMGYIVVKNDYDRIAAANDIVFPAGWSMEQALTLDEVGAILGVMGEELMLVENPNNNPDGGKPVVGYAVIDDPEAQMNQIIVSADVNGGSSLYEELKTQAVDGKTEEIAGIGDTSFLCKFSNIDEIGTQYTALVLLRGDIVVQVYIPTEAWTNGPYNYDTEQLALAIGFQLVDNMTNIYRNIPDFKIFN